MRPALRAGNFDKAVQSAVVDLGAALALQAAGDAGQGTSGSDWSGLLSWGLIAGFLALIGSVFVRQVPAQIALMHEACWVSHMTL